MPNFYNLLRAIKFSSAADTAVEISVYDSATPNFTVDAGGKLSWGSGSTIADTSLYRFSENTLMIENNLNVSGDINVVGSVISHSIPEAASSLTSAVDGKILEISGSSVSLATTGGSWADGTQFTIISISGPLTVTAGSGTVFRADPLNGSNVKLRTQYSSATFIYKQTGSYWYVIGDLTSS